MSDTERKPHMSASALEMLERCGIQYDYRYIQKIRKPPGFAAHKGKGVHRSAQHNLQSIIDTEQPAPIDECLDIARDTVRDEVDGQGVILTPEEKEKGIKAVTGEAIDSAVRLSNLHYAELAPTINPTHVEREIVLEIAGFPYDLLGYIDVVADLSTTVRDLKTSGKSPAEDAAHRSTQLTIYSLAVETIDKTKVLDVALDFLVETKSDKCSVKTITSTRTQQHYQSLFDTMKIAVRAIESGVFVPAPPAAWWCSENWCGYFAECPFGRRRLTQYAV